jgi:hypothetical protein
MNCDDGVTPRSRGDADQTGRFAQTAADPIVVQHGNLRHTSPRELGSAVRGYLRFVPNPGCQVTKAGGTRRTW